MGGPENIFLKRAQKYRRKQKNPVCVLLIPDYIKRRNSQKMSGKKNKRGV